MVAKRWAAVIFAPSADRSSSPTNIFAPVSKPVKSICELSILVLSITAILGVVFSLLAYTVLKFRRRQRGCDTDVAQVYGSKRVELAWTIFPVLMVLVLFLGTAQELRSEGTDQD